MKKLSDRFKEYWQVGLTTSRANIYRQEFTEILDILKAHEDGWFDPKKPQAQAASEPHTSEP